MIFLSLIAVLAIMYWSSNTATLLQRDGWFIWLLNRLRALPAASSFPLLPMLLAFILPLLTLMVCIWAIVHFLSINFLFFIYVPVLLYSLGRGDFLTEVNNYIATANRGDSVAASKLIDDLRGQAADDNVSEANDWKSLHTQALKVISYRGFERTFAVLFWFVIAGAVGALLYRLSAIYREQTTPHSNEALLADKWLWLIEFPAVRLMGLTWAFVGNFDSSPLRDSLIDTENSSMTILNNSLRGALGAPTDLYIKPESEPEAVIIVEQSTEIIVEQTEADIEAEENAQEIIEDLVGISLSPQAEPAYSFALVKSSVPLYSRSLLFWVGAIAFATLFI
ncbi:MAG: transcriptional regulator [Gammaproteobacteria bacterium]|nr:MAG: transcriptional regulator [Gammaproteobacteria bacterium]